MGEEGFSGPSSLLYHRHSPSAIVRIEAADVADADVHAEPAGRAAPPAHDEAAGRTGPTPCTGRGRPARQRRRASCRTSTATATSPLYRNAVGDELVYVQSGQATLESVFGRLPVGAGDYVVVPTGVTHRWVVADGRAGCRAARDRRRAATSRSRAKYLTATGQLAEGAPFCERDLRGPDREPLLVDGTTSTVLVRTRAGLSRHVHRDHPFDVVGWDGCVYPWAFSIHDFEPIVGAHPPAAAGAPDVRRCRVRRLLVRAPASTTSIPTRSRCRTTTPTSTPTRCCSTRDGDFMSRAGSGIGVGSISLHPAGFVHGPQPGSRERSESQDRTERAGGDDRHVRARSVSARRRATSATPTTRGRGRAEGTSPPSAIKTSRRESRACRLPANYRCPVAETDGD